MIAQRPQLMLAFGADRSLVWEAGESVRYLVADLAARGTLLQDGVRVPLNLALAIDVSGSMAGDKISAARRTAAAVVEALGAEDTLTVVAFDSTVTLVLEPRMMDAAGKRAAQAAISRLESGGSTDLFGGWELAAHSVATVMARVPRASHRVLLLTDGQANHGISDAPSLARYAGDAQRQGIITSAVGIGDDYAEALLAAMTEAGGGRLHDASDATEIHEVVIGELLEGRASLVERVMLSVTVPAQVSRVEVVGPWGAQARGSRLEVIVGSLRPDQLKRVVLRVFCPAGVIGETLEIRAAATAQLPDGSATVTADAPPVLLTFADGATNDKQRRDAERTLVAAAAWQGAAMRQALQLNGIGERDQARRYLRRELQLLRRYATGIAEAEPLLHELELLYQQIGQVMEERSRKEIYLMQAKRSRGEKDLRTRAAVDMETWIARAKRPRRKP